MRLRASPDLPAERDRPSVTPETSYAVSPAPMHRWRFHALCQVEGFAHVRRQLGPRGADDLVEEIARMVRHHPAGSTVTVIGRNLLEFAFDADDATALEQCLAELRVLCEQRFQLPDGVPLALTFGTAVAPAQSADAIALAEQAEAALHEARAVGHTVSHGPAPSRGLRQMAAEIEQALENDQLVLMYQPKIHVRRQQIASAEALIRWRHPERGMVMPNEFIPVAEQSHLIARMTLWAIRQAITDQLALAARGHDLRLFINISGQLLSNAPFVRVVSDLVAASDAKLGFEITETSVIRDPASAIANLQVFADIGIVIAIDDYGAGLSSLAYLKQLPARELKIDKLFVTQLTSSHRDPLIVRSTIDLAHALEMEVVAEGVETHAALALLTVMGCDMVQGFLISRPIALDALISYLEEGRPQETPEQTRAMFGRLATSWKGN